MSVPAFIVPFSVQDDLPKSMVILLSRVTISDAIDKILEYAYHPKPEVSPELLDKIYTFSECYRLVDRYDRYEIERCIKDNPTTKDLLRSRSYILDRMRIREGKKTQYSRTVLPIPKCGYPVGRVVYLNRQGKYVSYQVQARRFGKTI